MSEKPTTYKKGEEIKDPRFQDLFSRLAEVQKDIVKIRVEIKMLVPVLTDISNSLRSIDSKTREGK